MSTADDLVLAIDLGTTATKAVVFAVDGTVVASGEAGYPLREPEPGAAVQDPETVWDAVGDAVAAAAAGTDPRRIAAVSCSGAMHGLLGVDRAGEPVGPLLTWADARAADTAAALRADPDTAALPGTTGVPLHAMSPLVKLAWLRRHRPSLHAAPARWGGIKEFVVGRATGSRVTDRATDLSCASGTGLLTSGSRVWAPQALEVAGITADRLDGLVGTTDVVGTLAPRVAADWGLRAGTPVVVGGADGPLANLGLGAVRPGVLACSIGTSGALRVTLPEARPDEAGRLFCYALTDARWTVGGAITNGGVVLDWAAETLGAPVAVLLDEAAATPPGADGLLALPTLLAERAPAWDGRVGGALVGLTRAHSRGHVVRALLEGVCRQLRLVLDTLRDARVEVTEVRATGGFARSAFWRQLLPDVLGTGVAYPAAQGSALGAALLGAQGVGLVGPDDDDLVAAADRVTAGPDAEVVAPAADDAPGHEARLRIARELGDDLAAAAARLRAT